MAVSTTSVPILSGTGSSLSVASLTDPASLVRYIVSTDGAGEAVYRASASFAPVATADRTLISIKGSATKTVRIRKIAMMGTIATTAASNLFQINRTTALGSGGTSVAPTPAKVDSGTVASATAVVAHYTTAAQSLGTGPTVLSSFTFSSTILGLPASGSATNWFVAFPEMGGAFSQALVLRGTSDFLEIGNVAGNSPATAIQYVVEWSEDGS